MRHIFKSCVLFFCVICLVVFSSRHSYGQAGWKWGIAARSTVDTAGPKAMEPLSTAIDNAGNIFVTGLAIGDSTCFGPFAISKPNFLLEQLAITKADSSGHFEWAVGSQNSDVWPFGSAADLAGNLYVYGRFDSSTITIGAFTLTNTSGGWAAFLMKIDPAGTVLWVKNIPFFADGNMGTDRAGNTYITGEFRDSITIGGATLLDSAGAMDVFLAKYDMYGNPVWAKKYGGSCDIYSAALAVAGTDVVYIYGSYNSATAGYVTIGSTRLTASYDGISWGDNYLAKFDSSGNATWAEKINNNTLANTIVAGNSEELYMAGSMSSSVRLGPDTLTLAGEVDALVAKFDASGNILWARSGGGASAEQVYSLSADLCGHVWVTGPMGDGRTVPYTMSFGGHMLTTPPAAVIYGDPIFIAEYDTAGNYITSMAELSGGDDYAGILADNYGDFYIVGDNEFAGLRFGADTLYGDALGEYLFIGRYQFDTAACYTEGAVLNTKIAAQGGITVYPNPCHDEISIVSPAGKINNITMLNLQGQIVFSHEYNLEKVRADVANLPPGMYFIKINGTHIEKFVKE